MTINHSEIVQPLMVKELRGLPCSIGNFFNYLNVRPEQLLYRDLCLNIVYLMFSYKLQICH